jgi:uncharacterized membrane protein YhiD involved in acid resistance
MLVSHMFHGLGTAIGLFVVAGAGIVAGAAAADGLALLASLFVVVAVGSLALFVYPTLRQWRYEWRMENANLKYTHASDDESRCAAVAEMGSVGRSKDKWW